LFLPLSFFPQALQDIAHWLPSYGVGGLGRVGWVVCSPCPVIVL